MLDDGFENLIGDIPAQRQNSNNSESSGNNTAITDLDHDYTRRSFSASDSGVTSDSGVASDNPVSPQFSDTTESVYSSTSSPTHRLEEQKINEQNIPSDLFETLDAASLMNDGLTDDVIKGFTQNSNFTVDLDRKYKCC